MTDMAEAPVRSFKKEQRIHSLTHTWLAAGVSLVCNSLYAIYHGILGISHSSLWLLSISAFYSILAVMRFIILLYGKFILPQNRIRESWIFRIVGVLLILLSAVLAYVNAISLSQRIATAYDTIPMITIATYTFYKVAAVIVRALRPHNKEEAMFLALQNISCAEVAASVLTLQRSMLVSFGKMEKDKICLMNGITGAGIFLFVLALGVIMIARSGKEDQTWQNQNL